jgi:hypothetical protein
MKKMTTVLVAALVGGLLVIAGAQGATKTTWTAALTSGKEVPKQVVKKPDAHGQFKGTVTGKTLKWKLTFSKLTGPAIAAHIHKGAKGKAGSVLITLCEPCKSGATGTAKLTTAQMSAFKKHLLYVNVHTAKNSGGEIRGQIAAG